MLNLQAMDIEMLHHLRFIPVVVLLGAAAALLRRKGEPPLALRGLKKVLGVETDDVPPIPLWRRLLAFACVVVATVLAVV